MGELVLAYHVMHDLTVSDLLHSAILAGVDVEPVQMLSVNKTRNVSEKNRDKGHTCQACGPWSTYRLP
jgi:hypothetical protein